MLSEEKKVCVCVCVCVCVLAGFPLPHSFISLLRVEKWYKRACNNLIWVPWSLFSDWVLLHLLTIQLLIFKYI